MSKPSKINTKGEVRILAANASDAKGLDRRRFFMMGGSAIAAAAIVPVVGKAKADKSQSERVKARYRETDHVKNYYRVNRY